MIRSSFSIGLNHVFLPVDLEPRSYNAYYEDPTWFSSFEDTSDVCGVWCSTESGAITERSGCFDAVRKYYVMLYRYITRDLDHQLTVIINSPSRQRRDEGWWLP
jgi:hypothetical protein